MQRKRYHHNRKRNPMAVAPRPRAGRKTAPAHGKAIAAGAGVLVLAAALGLFLWRPWVDELAPVGASAPGGEMITLAPATPGPGESRAQAGDATAGTWAPELDFQYLNQPCLYGDELLFSAGDGAIDKPVLSGLYLYSLKSGTCEEVARTEIDNGEIYETQLNDRYICYVDSDMAQNNVIYCIDRASGERTKIKECPNGKPKLRLAGDSLIWMEQTDENVDKLYLIDLKSQENIALATFEDAATYGVSAPCITDSAILWAAPDPDQSAQQREAGEKSVIQIFQYLSESQVDEEGNLIFDSYAPGTYVHEPVACGDAIAWIDANKAPESKLYLSVGQGKAHLVDENVTAYAIGEGYLCYSRDEAIWAYRWADGQYFRLSPEGQKAMLPAMAGKTVLWFDVTNLQEQKDQYCLQRLDCEGGMAAYRAELAAQATPEPEATPETEPAPESTPQEDS